MENGKPNGSERLSGLRARTLLEPLWRGNGAPKVASGTPWASKMASKIVIPSGVPPTHDFDHDASQQRINLRGCWLHLPGGESSDKWGIEATSQKIMRYSLTFFVFFM